MWLPFYFYLTVLLYMLVYLLSVSFLLIECLLQEDWDFVLFTAMSLVLMQFPLVGP